MNMHQDALGDYRMINTVTAFVPDSRIGWGPAMDPDCDAAKNFEGVDVSGHTYTWDLHEADGRTEVTETYEWTGVKDPQFEKLFPLVSQEDLNARSTSSPEPSAEPSAVALDTGQRILRGPVSSRRGGAPSTTRAPTTDTPVGGGEHRLERERAHLGQVLGELADPPYEVLHRREVGGLGAPVAVEQRRGARGAHQRGGVAVGHRDHPERAVAEQLGGRARKPERDQ